MSIKVRNSDGTWTEVAGGSSTGGGGTWGSITGTLSDQTDLQGALDSKIGRYDTMPSASASLADGKIYQFIGATTADYTHGYFYECKESTTTAGTYEWVQTSIQPGSSGGTWGSITGTLSDQTDLQDALDAKVNLDGSSILPNGLKFKVTNSLTRTLSTNTDALLKWGTDYVYAEKDVRGSTTFNFNSGFEFPGTGVYYDRMVYRYSYRQYSVKFSVRTLNALTAGTNYSIIPNSGILLEGQFSPFTSVLSGSIYGGGGVVGCFVTYLGEVIITPMVNIPANGVFTLCGIMFANN